MRVLLTSIAVLAITASASAINGANSGVVDDFESYLDDADLNMVYHPGLAGDWTGEPTSISLNYDDISD